MPETIRGGVGHIELVLELNVVGILRVLLLLISEELRIKVGFIVRLGVVFVFLHIIVVCDGER